MTQRIVVDTSVLVAVVDQNDKFHIQAMSIASAAASKAADLVYFDQVVIETIGALCRRSEEQKRSSQLPGLLTSLEQIVPAANITWTGSDMQSIYYTVLALVRKTNGVLNFNDALLATLCQELGINTIASFDRDFDQIDWLKRIAKPEDLQPET